MRRTTLRLLLILSTIFCLTIQGQVSNARVDKSRQVNAVMIQKPLRLTTSIVSQRYCASNQLMLTLKLTYTNGGDHPLILFRFAKVIHRALISRSMKEAGAKKYEQDSAISTRSIMDYSTVETPSPGPLFAILKPGESLEDEDVVNVFINDGAPKHHKFLSPGDYFLEVRAATWRGSTELAQRLRARWKQDGDFWSWDIKSLPMPFKIEETRNVVNCLTQTSN